MGMVNTMRRNRRRHFIESYEFSTPLIAKLRSELGDRRKAEIALDGLRGWYLACLYADGRLIGMPSRAVDVAWHEMILTTREYMWFCERAFGGYLHHNPDSTIGVPMQEILSETLAVLDEHKLPLTLFTADAEAGIEDGYHWDAADLDRMRDEIAARRQATRARRRAAGATSAGEGFAGFVGFDGGGGGSDGGGGGGCGGGGGGCGGGGG